MKLLTESGQRVKEQVNEVGGYLQHKVDVSLSPDHEK